uniref:Coiled-coil-helix-coiled-coil-helix domain-containing protein 7 n=2 Tax=Equus asinus TaxID=9793 RepID=A0A9L0I7N5_EQUAS
MREEKGAARPPRGPYPPLRHGVVSSRPCLRAGPFPSLLLPATRVYSGRGRGSKKTTRMPLVTRRLRDPDINPCLSESDASTRCMDENNYDRESCSTYFLKYKNCRKFWNSIMIQRRQNGVKPSMPTAAERDEILGAMGKMPY